MEMEMDVDLPDSTAPRSRGLPGWMLALGIMLVLMLVANLAMVMLSSRGGHDLVRSDYYQAGLDQDGVMARSALGRARAVSGRMAPAGPAWRVEAEAGAGKASACKARFYRPDDGKEDFSQVLRLSQERKDGRALWLGPPVSLRRGRWLVRLIWEADGRPIMETSFAHRSAG